MLYKRAYLTSVWLKSLNRTNDWSNIESMQITLLVFSFKYSTLLAKQAGQTVALIKYLHGYGNAVATQPSTSACVFEHRMYYLAQKIWLQL